MSENSPIRDVVGEAMRRERLGDVHPQWSHWYEDAREAYRGRADHLIRILARAGVAIVRIVDGNPDAPVPSSSIIYQDKIVGRNAERQLRRGAGDNWEVAKVESGETAVQLTFTLAQAYDLAGRALQGDREVATAPGILTTLAAALEIHRMHAADMEPSS